MHRTARIKINNSYSEKERITQAIPQGAPSSVLLSTIYTAELSTLKSSKCNVIAYVDDTTLIIVEENTEQGLDKTQKTLD